MFYDIIDHWQFRYYLLKKIGSFFTVFLTISFIVIANTKFCFLYYLVCCDINHARVRAGQSISHTEKTTASQDVEEASKSEDDEWEDLSLPHEDNEAAISRTSYDPKAVCKLKPLGANGDGDNNARVEAKLEEEARAAEAESDLDLLARLMEDSLRIDPRWEAGPKDLCVVFWSSGTTGAPKGIPKTNQQLLAGKRTD
jgi:acyl-CoA synthetase (AMP-forming)/AMP-acid ligase II